MSYDKDNLIFKFKERARNLFKVISHPMFAIVHPYCYNKDGRRNDKDCYIGSGKYDMKIKDDKEAELIKRNIYDKNPDAPKFIYVVDYRKIPKSAENMLLKEGYDFSVIYRSSDYTPAIIF